MAFNSGVDVEKVRQAAERLAAVLNELEALGSTVALGNGQVVTDIGTVRHTASGWALATGR